MSWLSDLIRNELVNAFDDPAIQEQARQAVIRVLDDKEVLDKLHALIDARIRVVLFSPDLLPPLPNSLVEPILPGETLIVADLNTIPDRMRQAGFQGSDNALYYSLAYVAAFGPGTMPDDGAGSLVELSRRSPEIEAWWLKEMNWVIEQLEHDTNFKAVAIANDGRDRCGFRLGEAIMRDLREFGDRVTLGQIVPESEY